MFTMTRNSFILIFLGLLVCAQPAAARVVEQLTLARVPVADRSDIEFARGTSKALELVLVKLTGDSRTPRSERGRAVLAKAKRLVQQFGYEKSKLAGNADELLLRVEFDPQVLTDEMRANGLVLWGKERPETRLYVVVTNAGERLLLSDEAAPPGSAAEAIRAIILRQAQNRGIPVSFPNIETASLIESSGTASNILLSAQSVEQDSRVDGVAAVVFSGSEIGLWEADWAFQIGDQRESFSDQGDLVALLAEEATDSLADLIGRRYANPVLLGHKESLRLVVSGLYDERDFARVTRYLDSLDGVEGLFIQRVSGDALELSAVVQGGQAGLEQSVAFGRVIAPVEGVPGQFRLLGR